jgi:fluoroacetyl-CoA thioesterase
MDVKEIIHPGMTLEKTIVIAEQHLAAHLGSGSLRVLATPAMISFMESISHQLLVQYLPEGFSSVGTHVDVYHLAPTPLGNTVRVTSEVMQIDGIRVQFNVQAWDEREQIGKGLHERVVIDHARFLRRVAAKSETS